MNVLKTLLGKEVDLEISGGLIFNGILIDYGLDIIVIFNGVKFLYIPLVHVHNMREKAEPEIFEDPPDKLPIQKLDETNLSYRKTLNNAKGQFLEIFVTGNRSIHGYITNVMTDYVVFYSPVYKTMFISMQHLKWLTPYNTQLTPYTLSKENLPVVPSGIPVLRTFDEQLQKYVGQLVVFVMGDNPDKVGLLKEIHNNIVSLITADGNLVIWKLYHLKTVHIP
jgi:hypothetical protein